jgi:4-hydroxybenzoate polyprenyltransferase
MRLYCAEMYPLPPRLLTAALVSASFATLLARIHGVAVADGWRYVLLGCFSVFGSTLILRLMDEIKDIDLDRALFPERPLPSGRVRESDVRLSLAVAAALYLPAHAGAGAALLSAAVVLGYSFLMFRWFFAPSWMRPRLGLTLATHTPIVPLLMLHLLVLFAVAHGLTATTLRWAPSLLLAACYWALVLAWEVSRKIRSAEEEDAYVTYSRLLGRRAAVALAAAAQSFAFAGAVLLSRWQSLSWAFPALVGLGWAAACYAHLRFVLHPAPATSRLRPFSEASLFGLLLGGCLA